MPLTGFLKIENIKGESRAAGHEDEIDITGIAWGVARTQPSRVQGRSRVEERELVVRKVYDASSPYLAVAVALGRSFDEIVLTVRKDSGDAHLDYLTITLSNALISEYSFDSDTAPEEAVEEAFSIRAEKVKILYVQQADDHSAGDENEVELDFATLP